MKKIIRDNYRVVVLPNVLGFRRSTLDDHGAMRRLLADIERDVQRHVDDVGQVVPRWDTREECSHCGCGWEVLTAAEAALVGDRQDEHSVEGEPVCCEAGINEFRTQHGIPLLSQSGGAA